MKILLLTCPREHAEAISRALLEQRLVACVKNAAVDSMFWWLGEIESAEEALLVMETTEERFGEIERAVQELHPDDTFVLVQLPVEQASPGVEQWLREEARGSGE